jgi:hypothetical protein
MALFRSRFPQGLCEFGLIDPELLANFVCLQLAGFNIPINRHDVHSQNLRQFFRPIKCCVFFHFRVRVALYSVQQLAQAACDIVTSQPVS